MPDGEIPSIVFDRADMVMADGSPSANSQVRTIAMACPNVALNVGIFFDGTYNNAANVTAFDYGETAQTGGSYDNSHTNVFRLSLLYFGADQNTRAECGSIDTAYHSAYVEGIGSSTGGDDSGYAAATGHGPSGLEEKLDKGVRALRQFINQHGGLDNLRDVNVDVFGFSRGSATARVFCNAIVSMNEPKVNVRFLGIYDTVGSFGIPGNYTEMTVGQELARAYCDVPLNINPMCWLVPSESTINMNISGQSAWSNTHSFMPTNKFTRARSTPP
ncbi:hypothetical protein TRM7557_01755 [Tritonibacter multivorans]|uniref:Uncharacterized protein n=1 Tax=Tritonibacter multivorans TaxID=928856 RepID=A0A0P1G9B9_9RHOB|nr:DUF2235 domain-containing protein [Tritonibacter multivorans]MDA7423011.1 DUF2235 domain-containing protein [Tritonibacter multivorans]CUH78174.1 hypothetical protein TRM7557_01755 [Tritonibacter multivorans]SFD76733.1 Uncharacterized alpha/beta hydrolase domain [Tritonibacter multivorans]